MNFANWLSKVTDFLNFGKLLVDGAPGFIMAVALLFAVNHITEIPLLGSNEQIAKIDKELKSVDADHVKNAKQKEKKASKLSSVQKTTSSLNEKLTAAQKTRSESERLWQKTVEDAIATLKGKIAKSQAEEKELGAAVEKADSTLQALNNTKAKLTGKRAELLPYRIDTPEKLLNFILSYLVGLTFVGTILGALTAPVNRLLLLRDLLSRRPLRTLKSPAVAWPSGDPPMPPTYYIGLNVITKDDWDGIVTSYYRWTELALNLVFPIFLSGVVYCFVGEDESTFLGVDKKFWPWISLAAAFLVWRIGAASYGTYRNQVEKYIKGRLHKIEADKKAAASQMLGQLKASIEALKEEVAELAKCCKAKSTEDKDGEAVDKEEKCKSLNEKLDQLEELFEGVKKALESLSEREELHRRINDLADKIRALKPKLWWSASDCERLSGILDDIRRGLNQPE